MDMCYLRSILNVLRAIGQPDAAVGGIASVQREPWLGELSKAAYRLCKILTTCIKDGAALWSDGPL